MAAEHGLKIERREYKYLLDTPTIDRIREAIAPFCVLDKNAVGKPDNRYTIESLYFDDHGMKLYWNNEVEAVDRFKLRIRHYPQSPGGPVFLEVKRRFNDVISKTRGRVPAKLWQEVVADPPYVFPDAIRAQDRPAVERFLAIKGLGDYRPVTVVRYEREPHVSLVDDYARVTFDTRIKSQRTTDLGFDLRENGWRHMDDALTMGSPTSLTVLELKFTSAVPSWMVNIVRSLELQRLSFSKYGTSIRAWYSKPSPRSPNTLRNSS